MKSDYWNKYWNEAEIIKEVDPQKQIGRTVNKIPITSDRWQETLNYIAKTVELDAKDRLVDLCAGNGLIAIPFAKKCRHVLAIDVSKELLSKINTSKNPNIETQIHDIRTLEFSENLFSKIILYASIQYLTEKETILLFEKAHKWLTNNGLFFIGDIPDVDKLWNFSDTNKRRKAYFESLKYEKPIIGNWFKKEFLIHAAEYAGFSKSCILNQPKNQINSSYRFDILLKK